MKTIKPLIAIVCGFVCTSVAYGQLGLGTMTRGTLSIGGGSSIITRTSHATELGERSTLRNARSKAKRNRPATGVMTNAKSSSTTQIGGNAQLNHQGNHTVQTANANGPFVNATSATTIKGTGNGEAALHLNSQSLADKAVDRKEKITTAVAERSGDAIQKVKETKPAVKAEGSTVVTASGASKANGTSTSVDSKVGAASTISKQ